MRRLPSSFRSDQITKHVIDQAFGKYPYNPIVGGHAIVEKGQNKPHYVTSVKKITPIGTYAFSTGAGTAQNMPSYNITVGCGHDCWRVKNAVPFLSNMGEPATKQGAIEWGDPLLVMTAEVSDVTFVYSSRMRVGFVQPQPHIAKGAKTKTRLFWVNSADIERRLSNVSMGYKSPLSVMVGPKTVIETEGGNQKIDHFVTETMGQGILHYPNYGFVSPFSSVNHQIISTPFNQVGHAELLHWIQRQLTDFESTEELVTEAFYNPAVCCGVNMVLRQFAAGKYSAVQPDLSGIYVSPSDKKAPLDTQNIQIKDVFSV